MTDLPLGELLGTSEWVTVTQHMIDAFGAATLDPDPMHVDPEWARGLEDIVERNCKGFRPPVPGVAP